MINPFSRWIEALPMTDPSAETVAKDMISTWQRKSWVYSLPFVLPGIRTSLNGDEGYSSFELIYGSSLCLNAEFVTKISKVKHSEFVKELQRTIRHAKPSDTTTHGNKTIFVSKQHSYCSPLFTYKNATLQPVHPCNLFILVLTL
ncbi:hypothetical protein TNCT_623911 [Trichonephila clavata]|uniref:Uncharacterized protein n=1 Tax=Trichonephila clavata TaxID=2740835 RepID=A0A8X6FZ75_TRICU|nr:hypothetical protein TNCT_623911 [Trichonephila clavata]